MAYVNVFRDAVLALLEGTGGANDIDINYVALGDGQTPHSATDTQLENEQFRRAVDSKTIETDLIRSITNILSGEANTFDIYEIGIFANGTAAANSGTLVSRIVFSTPVVKTSAVTLSIIRTDKVVI